MNRATVALLLEAVFFALAFGWRSWVQWRRTGSTGFIRPRRGASTAELLGSIGFVLALVLLVAAPLADLAGMAIFLASPASEYCHGGIYPVDGGWLAR